MFKTAVPVLSLILLAGPVLAADSVSTTDQSVAAACVKGKKHHAKKHHRTATGSTHSAQPK